MARRIAVIGGTGDQGFGLVLRFARADEAVIIGSRSKSKAEDAAKKALELLGKEASVTGDENAKAAEAADIIIMSVPFAAHVDMIKSIQDRIRPDAIFIDVVVPLSTAVGGKPTTALGVWEGSAAQQAAKLLPPSTKLASAFHNVVAESLQDLNREVDCDVIVCSDSHETRKSVMDLVNEIPGIRAIDGGRLENSRVVEQLTALLIGINIRYRVKYSGIRITGIQPEQN
ncbi:MAG TPA: NADPH-dependent F420 reductase [Candidatus Saccharimonadales bacterium]|nr:NADPH-dependent F420 reductase [Candidatus Saccharimonadales bacterium]